ncbi:MAG: phosphatase PAP2 family protein, partial [Halothiobacillus sp.]|nr:phosphatase PAP2 family protein [Halothiobacillus sp.]
NPELVARVRAHPRLFGFLGARLNRQQFSGLPLTLFGVAFLYLLLLFGGLVEDLIMSDPIVALDHSVAEVMVALRTPAWEKAAMWVSNIGVWQVVVAILLASCIWLWFSRRRFYILPLLISVSGSTLFAFAGKWALHRARPLEAAVHEASYAFPSGHALISISLFGFLAYIWLREISSWPMRVNIFFAWLLLALAIGLSRIVLGVHFPSDVLGGYLLGGLWLLVAIVWAEWTRTRIEQSQTRSMPFALPLALVFVGAVYSGVLLAPARTPPVPVPEASISQLLPQQAESFLETHLPHYVRGTLGARVQPLSVALLVGDEAVLRNALHTAGWTQASPIGASALLKLAREGLDDLQAPSVPLFWNNELYTLAYNRHIQTSKQTEMLSLLLWKTSYRNAAGETLWVGIVRAYWGMHWYPARRLLPDLDAAREQALMGFQMQGCLVSTKRLPWVAPQIGQTFTEDEFFTRGDLVFSRFDSRCR